MDDSTLLIAIASFGTAFAARPFLAVLVIGAATTLFHHFGAPLEGLPGAVMVPAFVLSTGEMFVLWRLRGFWDEVPLPIRAGGHAVVCFITAALLIHGQVSQAPAVGVAVVATFFLAFEWSRFRGQLLVFDPGNGLSLAMLLGAAEVVFTIGAGLLAVFLPPGLAGAGGARVRGGGGGLHHPALVGAFGRGRLRAVPCEGARVRVRVWRLRPGA